MKKNLILFACIILILSACSKDHDSNGGSANSWTFAGTAYKASQVLYIDAGGESNLTATATGGTTTSANGLTFTFIPPPTSSGQVAITNSGDPNTVLISASNLTGTTTTFYTNDVTTTNASVTLNNGKVSATFQGSIWLHNLSDFDDSAQVSVSTITEQ